MKHVSIRELLRNPRQFLSPQNFILTRYGKPILEVSVTNLTSVTEVSDKVPDNTPKCQTNTEYVTNEWD